MAIRICYFLIGVGVTLLVMNDRVNARMDRVDGLIFQTFDAGCQLSRYYEKTSCQDLTKFYKEAYNSIK